MQDESAMRKDRLNLFSAAKRADFPSKNSKLHIHRKVEGPSPSHDALYR